MNKKKGSILYLHIYFWKKLALRNIYVALCTAADIFYIYTWYLHDAATRGLRSIHHQTGGPGCRGAHRHHSQALRHSRKSTSLSETKGVWYLWRSEAASQALRLPSSLYTEEEQFMELFLEVKWRIKQNKTNIHCNYISIYANSKYGMQLYINKTGPLLWPRFTIPVRFGILAL